MPPGTVVDTGSLTERRDRDSLLISHFAIIGTARPCHYFILHDEIFARKGFVLPIGCKKVADAVERITWALCYMHERATTAVGYAAPIYLADIVCHRGMDSVNAWYEINFKEGRDVAERDVAVHENVKEGMYYI